jgi:hypothetical protein
MLKTLLAAALVALVAFAVKDHRLLERARLLGSCRAVPGSTADDRFFACRSGALSGRPDLSRNACTVTATYGRLEYWRCSAPLTTAAV